MRNLALSLADGAPCLIKWLVDVRIHLQFQHPCNSGHPAFFQHALLRLLPRDCGDLLKVRCRRHNWQALLELVKSNVLATWPGTISRTLRGICIGSLGVWDWLCQFVLVHLDLACCTFTTCPWLHGSDTSWITNRNSFLEVSKLVATMHRCFYNPSGLHSK